MSRSVFESRRDPLRLPLSPEPCRPRLEPMPRRASIKRVSRGVETLISALVVGFVMFWLLRHL